jgi:beta-phosphoglucomutase-like phosphatase (HAD superfamily)
MKLGIGSSSHRKLITYVLKKLEIENLFEAVIGAEDITCGKPNPEIFLMCAKTLNANPVECLVVEDAKLGVEAAKTAEMKCLGYRNPSSGKQDLSKADLITDDLSKLDIQKLLL